MNRTSLLSASVVVTPWLLGSLAAWFAMGELSSPAAVVTFLNLATLLTLIPMVYAVALLADYFEESSWKGGMILGLSVVQLGLMMLANYGLYDDHLHRGMDRALGTGSSFGAIWYVLTCPWWEKIDAAAGLLAFAVMAVAMISAMFAPMWLWSWICWVLRENRMWNYFWRETKILFGTWIMACLLAIAFFVVREGVEWVLSKQLLFWDKPQVEFERIVVQPTRTIRDIDRAGRSVFWTDVPDVAVHYKVGTNNRTHVCSDSTFSPDLRALIEETRKDVTLGERVDLGDTDLTHLPLSLRYAALPRLTDPHSFDFRNREGSVRREVLDRFRNSDPVLQAIESAAVGRLSTFDTVLVVAIDIGVVLMIWLWIRRTAMDEQPDGSQSGPTMMPWVLPPPDMLQAPPTSVPDASAGV